LVFVYELVDLLQQLEHAKVAAKGDKSLWDQECRQEFQEEVEKLREELVYAQHIVASAPEVSRLSRDVSKLSDGYLSLIHEMERNHSEHDTEDLRKKIKEIEAIERQHAAEVKYLQSQLNAFMCTTVTADAGAVCLGSMQRSIEEPAFQHQSSAFSSTVVEAEALPASSSTVLQEAEVMPNISSDAPHEVESEHDSPFASL